MLDISIPKEDLDAITYWRNKWIDGRLSCPTEELLRPWEAAKKEYLYKMFGEQLILRKNFNTQTPMSMRVRYFEDNLTFVQSRFLNELSNYITSVIENLEENWRHPIFHIFTSSNLVHNIYDGPDIELKYRNEILRINHGMKIMKIIRKLMTLFNLNTPYHQEIFDDIRKLQSMANNTADLYGNLCISIHPLDYMTMSDNACDWESCMRWNYGDYRLGTVEMMNSPCVVVGYLESKAPFYLDGDCCKQYLWSNKKWRSLFVVTKDCIAAVKGYPYQSEELDDEILYWLKELAETNLGWKYDLGKVITKDNHTIVNRTTGELMFHKRIKFRTEYMYNDFYTLTETGHPAYLNSSINLNESIYYSGLAQCMECGAIIDYDDKDYVDNGASLVCGQCLGAYRYCEACGERLPGDDEYWYYTDKGEGPYCEYCFNEIAFTCPFTGDVLLKEDYGATFYFVEKFNDGSTLEEDIEDARKVYYDKGVNLKKLIIREFKNNELNLNNKLNLFERKTKNTTEYLIYVKDYSLARDLGSCCGKELLTASEKQEFELNFKAGEFKQVI